MEKQHTPGVSLGILKDGKLVLAKGYGLANVELSVPATKDTVYELLSVSKEFTDQGLFPTPRRAGQAVEGRCLVSRQPHE